MKLFLDTNILNRVVDFGEYIFEGCLGGQTFDTYKGMSEQDREDVDAICNIFETLRFGMWPAIVSNISLREIGNTRDEFRRKALMSYAEELRDYLDAELGEQVEGTRSEWLTSHADNRLFHALARVKDAADRELLLEAIERRCDVFLTVDRRSLWNCRDAIGLEQIRILRPVEAWQAMLRELRDPRPWRHWDMRSVAAAIITPSESQTP